MKDIINREDINLLVTTFYSEVRKNELLGPIFNYHIATAQWPAHLEKLTDFWETALLGNVCFKGNPSEAHLNVDAQMKYSIDKIHFDTWLQLWATTIDSLYVGSVSERAKEGSKRMAAGQFQYILKNRPECRI
jgi:hemoglobin